MDLSARGEKRRCMECEEAFYDLNRDPAPCPYCGHAHPLTAFTTGKAPPPTPKPAAKPAAAKVADDEDDDDDDVDLEDDDAVIGDDDELDDDDAAIVKVAVRTPDDES